MKVSLLIVLALMAGCSWFHHGRSARPDTPQFIVTGIPEGGLVYVDGAQVGEAQEKGNRSRVLDVAPGLHTVEIKRGDTVTYHENAYVGPGQKTAITVLSGNSRN